MPRFAPSNGLTDVTVNDVIGLTSFVATQTAAATAALVGTAPATLNTLGEIADAIGDSAGFVDLVVLKTGATMTGDINMGTKNLTSVGSIDTSTLKIGGTTVTANANDINKISGVTNGSAYPNKALIVDGSSSIVNINTISANSWVSTPGLSNAGNLAINHIGNLYLQDSTVSYATFNNSSLALKDNVAYSITHATNAVNQDLLIQKTGSNTSRLKLGSDGTTTDSILLFSGAGGITLSGNTGLVLGAPNGVVNCVASLTHSGIAPSANGTINNSITAAGSLSVSVTSATSLINITSGTALGLAQIPISGTVPNFMEIKLYNALSGIIILGHRASSAAGKLNCLWFKLHPGRSVTLMYDLTNTCWILQNQPVDLFNFNVIKWTGDNILNLYLNSLNTYTVKINYNNSITTINGQSGIDGSITTQTSGSGWSISNLAGGPLQGYSAGLNYPLTDTESNKFNNFTYNFTSVDFTVGGLTVGQYYMLQLYQMVYDATVRDMSILHVNTNKQIKFNAQTYSYLTAGTNAPAQIVTYIFKCERIPTETFTFTNPNTTAHMYGLFVMNLGASL